jgi:peptidyl-prolyl cis-trans isomerase A (cyclophilin A)
VNNLTICRRAIHAHWLKAAFFGICALACRNEGSDDSGAQKARLAPPAAQVAFAGLDGSRSIPVIIDTDQGAIHCDVSAPATPRGAALFIGLSRGRAFWLEPGTARIVTRPLYENLTFHRAIPNVMIQSGCPVGDGTGSPGYRIEVETHANDALELAQPGTLALARYTPAPGRADPNPPPPGHVIGSQFVITLVNMRHVAGQVTVIGRCQDLDVVRRISQLVGDEHARVGLRRIRVE